MNGLAASAAGKGLIVANGNEPLIVSSREIAEACDKRHDHVMRDITKMLKEIGKDAPKYGGMYEDAYGREKPCYFLPKDLTITLVTGYDAERRYKMVKRLEELEEAAKVPALPNFADPVAAARAWADQMERATTAEAKVIEYAPKAEAYDILDASEGAVTIREAAKLLNAPERKFVRWLQAHDWAFRQNGVGPLQGYAEKRNRGFLEHRPHTYHDAGRGEDRTVAQLMVTPKGLARLAQVFAKQGLPS